MRLMINFKPEKYFIKVSEDTHSPDVIAKVKKLNELLEPAIIEISSVYQHVGDITDYRFCRGFNNLIKHAADKNPKALIELERNYLKKYKLLNLESVFLSLKRIQNLIAQLVKDNNVEGYKHVANQICRIAQEQSINVDLMQCKIIKECRTYIEDLNKFTNNGGPKPMIVPDQDTQKAYHILCPNLNRQLEAYIQKENFKKAKAALNKSDLTTNSKSNFLKP